MSDTSSTTNSRKARYAPPTLIDYGSLTALTQSASALGFIIVGGLITATVTASVTAVVL